MTATEIVHPPNLSLSRSHPGLTQMPVNEGVRPEKHEERNDSPAKSHSPALLSGPIASDSALPNLDSSAEEKGATMKTHPTVHFADRMENFSSSSGADEKRRGSGRIHLSRNPEAHSNSAAADVFAATAKEDDAGNGAAVALPNGQQVKELRGAVTVVRPSPNRIKTTLPTIKDGVALVAPAPRPVAPCSSQKESPGVVFSLNSSHRDSQAETHPTEPEKKAVSNREQEQQQAKKPWCKEASVQARPEKEEIKKKKLEEQRRRQEIQTNFPGNEHSMPPTNGRASADEDMDEQGNADQYRAQHEDHDRTRPHPQNRSQQARVNLRSSSEMSNGGIKGDEDEGGSRAVHPTPLFERLVTEEVQELKAYARIIENQSRQLAEREKVYSDLEARLEVESRRRQQLEATLEARENQWSQRFRELESDRDQWKEVVQQEQTKNSRLIDQVMRKDQDIHRMLQRKFDHEGGRSVRSIRQATMADRSDRPPSGITASSRSPDITRGTMDQHRSPHEILAASGSAEKVRVRNAEGLLMDFFAM